MLDHDARSYQLIARVFAGQQEGLTCDDILDNVTLYWLTKPVSPRRASIGKRPTRSRSGRWRSSPRTGSRIPVAVTAFPDELYQAPRSWAERAYPKLVYYNKVDKGGHFAAWEQPQSVPREVRAAFRPMR